MWNFDPGGMEPTSNDLPLMANIKDVKVCHYLLDLAVDLEEKLFVGSVTLFLERPCKDAQLSFGASHHVCSQQLGNKDYENLSCPDDINKCTGLCCTDTSNEDLHLAHCGIKEETRSSIRDGVCNSDAESLHRHDPLPLSSTSDIRHRASLMTSCQSSQLTKPNTSENTSIDKHSPKSFETEQQDCQLIHESKAPGSALHNENLEATLPLIQSPKVPHESTPEHLQHVKEKSFEFILDSCDIDILAVEEVIIDSCKCNDGVITGSKENHALESQRHKLTTDSNGKLFERTEHQANSETCQKCNTLRHPIGSILGFKPTDFELRRTRFLSCRSMKGRNIDYEVEPWCIRIRKDGIQSASGFPSVVRIHYKTRACGKSLTWASDQDGSICVFTQGAWINNRSLFPCQEPPGAMATWQAIIRAPKEFLVLMSGDEEGRVILEQHGMVSTLHFTDMLQPSSIVAIAIGKWRCYDVPVSLPQCDTDSQDQHLFNTAVKNVGSNMPTQCTHEAWPCRIHRTDEPVIPSRIIAPPSLYEAAIAEFAAYLPRCLHAVFQLLGAHPFSRLDLLIVPRCFASLGLASPSIVFLSQSLLSGDGSLLTRLAHEISHSWFGILIGARDWTEEWLSEGFATFMEDSIHAVAQKWTVKEYEDHANLRALLRYRALMAELENTESELQIMRPMGEETGVQPGQEREDVGYVKNGLNPDKWFLQVHYLKGYFLLHHLASRLSMDKLLAFIKLYVHRYHGHLVLSRDIFHLLFAEFPELKEKGVTMESIYSDWLDRPGMPCGLNEDMLTGDNDLISAVQTQLKRWTAVDVGYQKTKSRKKKQKLMSTEYSPSKLNPDQLVLLLEYLLDAETMATETLCELSSAYQLAGQNAEVRHRWCELVVKHRHTAAYPDVRRFLGEDQAMGVYLYGELMASEDPVQQVLARNCFQVVAMEMDRGCYRTVHEMLYGEPAEREQASSR